MDALLERGRALLGNKAPHMYALAPIELGRPGRGSAAKASLRGRARGRDISLLIGQNIHCRLDPGSYYSTGMYIGSIIKKPIGC